MMFDYKCDGCGFNSHWIRRFWGTECLNLVPSADSVVAFAWVASNLLFGDPWLRARETAFCFTNSERIWFGSF